MRGFINFLLVRAGFRAGVNLNPSETAAALARRVAASNAPDRDSPEFTGEVSDAGCILRCRPQRSAGRTRHAIAIIGRFEPLEGRTRVTVRMNHGGHLLLFSGMLAALATVMIAVLVDRSLHGKATTEIVAWALGLTGASLYWHFRLRSELSSVGLEFRSVLDGLTVPRPIGIPHTAAPLHEADQSPVGEVPTERRFADVVVTGHRPKVTALLGQMLFAVILYFAIAPLLIRFDPKILPIALIFLIAVGVQARIKAFKRPPRATIEGGEFSLRLFPNLTLKTPAANVAGIDLRAGRLTVVFGALNSVQPVKSRTWLNGNFKKYGCHATTGRDVFTLEQVNQLRGALGKPRQSADLFEDFEQFQIRQAPRIVVTPALIAANVAVFLALAALGAGFFRPDVQLMIEWGANYSPLTSHGQWWRLFSSMFLHFGVLHLLMNMYILWDIGPIVERLLGSVGFAIGYLVAGFFGSVASAWWHDATPSVGASGAIFGIFGMLLGMVTGRQQAIPAAIIKEHRTNAVMFVVLNTALASGISGIDQAAHLGGFSAGWLCGLVFKVDLPNTHGRQTPRNLLLAVAASLAGFMAVHFLSTRTPDIMAICLRADSADNAASALYTAAIQRQESGAQTATETGAEIKEKILPLYVDLAEQLDRVPRRHGEQSDRLKTTMVDYIQLRREAWELMGQALENDDIVSQGRAILRFEGSRRLLAASNPGGDNKQVRAPADFHTEFAVLAVAEAQARQAQAALLERDTQGRLAAAETAAVFERDVVAVWLAGAKRFVAAAREFPVQDQPIAARTRKYIDLKTAGFRLLAESLRERDQSKADAGHKKLDEAGEAAKEIWPKSSNPDDEDQTK